ncbi:membrane hypothetical protein [Candidatus Zixiibacteriota bacterium]|nr:membrane hypothetical protein [candidate division Zixibacteria bacterium]
MNPKNVRLFYILEAVLALLSGTILPVYVVYFRHFGVTLLEVALLASVFEASIILFELPTGLFADRYGRKLSTAAGFLLFGISGLIFFHFRGFAGFLVAEIVFGIAETFISGALEALAVDSFDTEKREKSLSRLFSNRTAVRTAASLAGMIGGGLLAKYYLPILFIPIIALGFVGLVVSQFLTETSRNRTDDSTTNIKGSLKSLHHSIRANRIIMAIFAVGVLANLVFEGADQYWQVLFGEIRKIDVAYFGFFTAVGALLTLVFVRFSEYYYNRLGSYLIACFISIAVLLWVMPRVSNNYAINALVAYFLFKELIRPALSTHLNRQYKGPNRAAFLSGYNMICSVGEVFAGVIIGLLASQFGVPIVFYSGAVVAIAVPAIYLTLAKKLA